MRVNRRFFNAPLCDEVALSLQAKAHLETCSSPPTSSQIRELSRAGSSDLAARVLYEGLLASHHGDFVRYLDGLPDDQPVTQAEPVRLLIVPGMFYREHPEVGADGGLALEIARRFGFDAEIVALKSTGSVSQNSEILTERLEREQGAALWLLSLSKGTSDVRYCLQTHGHYSGVRGWVSVAGTPKGSPLAARKTTSAARRLFYRTLCKVTGVEYAALEEMAPNHPFWHVDDWPSALEIIHVLPIPLACHIQGILRSRHSRLLQYGPNDGFVPVTDVLELPGYIYPVWGSDHFMRIPQLSHLLYRLYNHIAQQTIKEREL
ncbi:MAG: hypothetical protein ABW077_07690 [Candidatus Thiodiazotropha endolucinida]